MSKKQFYVKEAECIVAGPYETKSGAQDFIAMVNEEHGEDWGLEMVRLTDEEANEEKRSKPRAQKTRPIRISEDVAQAIAEAALPNESPNNTIRRLLGFKPVGHKQGVRR